MVKLIRKATLEDVAQLVSLAIQMWKSHTVEDLTKIFCEHIRKEKNIFDIDISSGETKQLVLEVILPNADAGGYQHQLKCE